MKWLIEIAKLLGELLVSVGVYLLILDVFPSISNLIAVILTVLFSLILVWFIKHFAQRKK